MLAWIRQSGRSQLANSDIHDTVPERRAADARDLCRNTAAQAGRERRRVRPGRRAVPLVPVYVAEIRHLCGVRAHAAQRDASRDRNRSSALSAAAEDRDEFGAAGDFCRNPAAAAATDPGRQGFRPDRCALFLSGRRCGGTAGPGARSARRDHGARRRPRSDLRPMRSHGDGSDGRPTCCRPYHRFGGLEAAAGGAGDAASSACACCATGSIWPSFIRLPTGRQARRALGFIRPTLLAVGNWSRKSGMR